jgi:hypothetical protein
MNAKLTYDNSTSEDEDEDESNDDDSDRKWSIRKKPPKRNWMTKTRNSSLVFQHATHSFLPWIPMILHQAFVPFQNITNADKQSICSEKSFLHMNVIAHHIQQIHCNNIYVKIILIHGAALDFKCF